MDPKQQQDLREWRQDAVNRHQYDTAIYVGDKLLAMTGDDQDAFWLANAHFTAGQFNRCQALLARRGLSERNPQCRYLNAHCAVKLARWEQALDLLGDTNPTHLVSLPSQPSHASARQKLRHVDASKTTTTTTTTSTTTIPMTAPRSQRMPTSEERDREDANNLKAEAAMCYLRGLCYAHNNAMDRAKECYKTAVQIDVGCMEAFNALVDAALLSPEDEWLFLDSLNFDSSSFSSTSQQTPDLVRNLYITRLSKYARPRDFTNATETLSTHYALAANPDILRAKADLLYTQCRFQDALALTSSVLDFDRYDVAILPLHLAILYELRQTNALYLLSHALADICPDEPTTWLAVATYYLASNKTADSRLYFTKATQLKQTFGPAWIGFGHSFAAEGEHDQAISAYSTGARLFQGSHLPQVFLAMQNIELGNLALAREYCNTAYGLCHNDPLVLNEMGVIAYSMVELRDAISLFRRALDFAAENNADPATTLTTRVNLAHALRKHNAFDEALNVLEDVLRHGSKDATVFATKGLLLLESERSWDAVVVCHEALAVAPQDPMATDLLGRALEANESDSGFALLDGGHGGFIEDNEEEVSGFEALMRGRKVNGHGRVEDRVPARRGRRRRHAGGFVDEDEATDSLMGEEDS